MTTVLTIIGVGFIFLVIGGIYIMVALTKQGQSYNKK